MASRLLDKIVESLVHGGLDVDGFLHAVQRQIEDIESGPQRLR